MLKNFYQQYIQHLFLFIIIETIVRSIFGVSILFYRLCYDVGYIVIFAARLAWFLPWVSIKPLIKKLNKHNFWGRDFGADIACLSSILQESVKKALLKTGILSCNAVRAGSVAVVGLAKQKIQKVSIAGTEILHKKVEFKMPEFNFRAARTAFSFGLVLLIMVVPLRAFMYYSELDLDAKRQKLTSDGASAAQNFIQGAKAAGAREFIGAEEKFNLAGANFSAAREQLEEVNNFLFLLADLIPQKDAQLAAQSKNIVAAGESGATIGAELSLAFNSLLSFTDASTALNQFDIHLKNSLAEAKLLKIYFSKIDTKYIPPEHHSQFSFAKSASEVLDTSIETALELSGLARYMLGVDRDRRYLLVFQNNTELRPSGGFIGSFALLDVKNGAIKNFEAPKGGSYDTEGDMKVLVKAPEALSLVNPLWHFWDANWWPDWPTSAQKLEWFYEQSGGATVDGTVGISFSAFEDFLSVFGEIDLPNYGVAISKDNAWEVIQEIVEKKPDNYLSEEYKKSEENAPKKIIGDMMSTVLGEFRERLTGEKLAAFILLLEDQVKGGHIMLYLNDENRQAKIVKFGLAGEIKQTAGDYLMIAHTNIAGEKTDRVIKDEIIHKTTIDDEGYIVNEVRVLRRHNGIKGDQFTGVRNVDYLRAYVPQGSLLLEARGFTQPDAMYFEKADPSWRDDEDLAPERQALIHQVSGTKVYSEFGKTVFANWLMVDPGQTAEVYVKYRLPFKIDLSAPKIDGFSKIENMLGIATNERFAPYTFLFQKQPGVKNIQLKSDLVLPPALSAEWVYPPNDNDNTAWSFAENIKENKYFGTLLKINN